MKIFKKLTLRYIKCVVPDRRQIFEHKDQSHAIEFIQSQQ